MSAHHLKHFNTDPATPIQLFIPGSHRVTSYGSCDRPFGFFGAGSRVHLSGGDSAYRCPAPEKEITLKMGGPAPKGTMLRTRNLAGEWMDLDLEGITLLTLFPHSGNVGVKRSVPPIYTARITSVVEALAAVEVPDFNSTDPLQLHLPEGLILQIADRTRGLLTYSGTFAIPTLTEGNTTLSFNKTAPKGTRMRLRSRHGGYWDYDMEGVEGVHLQSSTDGYSMLLEMFPRMSVGKLVGGPNILEKAHAQATAAPVPATAVGAGVFSSDRSKPLQFYVPKMAAWSLRDDDTNVGVHIRGPIKDVWWTDDYTGNLCLQFEGPAPHGTAVRMRAVNGGWQDVDISGKTKVTFKGHGAWFEAVEDVPVVAKPTVTVTVAQTNVKNPDYIPLRAVLTRETKTVNGVIALADSAVAMAKPYGFSARPVPMVMQVDDPNGDDVAGYPS